MAFNTFHASQDNFPDQNNIVESTLDVIPKSDIQAQLVELQKAVAEQVLVDAIKSEHGEDEYESDLKNENLDGLSYTIGLKLGKDTLIKDAILVLTGKDSLKKYNENTILNIKIDIVIKDTIPYIKSLCINNGKIYPIIN